MRKGYVHFIREIYFYCDNNIEEKVLFPAFANLWHENGEANPIFGTDLAVLTSKIISRLLNKRVLEEIPKNDKSQNPYGLYRILPHENLRKYDDFVEKKMKLIKLSNAYNL